MIKFTSASEIRKKRTTVRITHTILIGVGSVGDVILKNSSKPIIENRRIRP